MEETQTSSSRPNGPVVESWAENFQMVNMAALQSPAGDSKVEATKEIDNVKTKSSCL